MRPTPESIPRGSAAATRHLRHTRTARLSAAIRLPAGRREATPGVVWQVLLWAAAFARSLAAARDAIPVAPTGRGIWDALRASLPRRRRPRRGGSDPPSAPRSPSDRGRPGWPPTTTRSRTTAPRPGTPPGASTRSAPTTSTRTPRRARSAGRTGTRSG
mgnify:CR=1 FL=1